MYLLGPIYTSAGPTVGTVVVPTTGVASLAQAKHCRYKPVLVIIAVFLRVWGMLSKNEEK